MSVIGACNVGSNVVFGAGSSIIDRDIPDDTVVLGSFPQNRLLPNRLSVKERCFALPPDASDSRSPRDAGMISEPPDRMGIAQVPSGSS